MPPLGLVDTMNSDIDKMRNEFFKISLSAGHHNIKYTWQEIMLMILSCIRSLESFEEGAKAPSAQTLRDRLVLDSDWRSYFESVMQKLAVFSSKTFSKISWYLSIDETYVAFFGKRKKLNEELKKLGLKEYVHGYTDKTPGATGSFRFLVVSFCSSKIRIPLAIKLCGVGEDYNPWLKNKLDKYLSVFPKSVVLADRGFAKVWFFEMLEELKASYVIRTPLKKKENKNKATLGIDWFQYWMKQTKTGNKVLLTIVVAKDNKNRKYFLATNIERKHNKTILKIYRERWDLENIFKDSDRIELPTSSRNPLMRLFCVTTSLFMFALWQYERLFTKPFSLRTFIKRIIDWICQKIGCIITPTGVIQGNKHPP